MRTDGSAAEAIGQDGLVQPELFDADNWPAQLRAAREQGLDPCGGVIPNSPAIEAADIPDHTAEQGSVSEEPERESERPQPAGPPGPRRTDQPYYWQQN